MLISFGSADFPDPHPLSTAFFASAVNSFYSGCKQESAKLCSLLTAVLSAFECGSKKRLPQRLLDLSRLPLTSMHL